MNRSIPRWRMLLATIPLLSALSAFPASAGTLPQRVNFQGKLLDSANNPRNGTVLLEFRLYPAPSGGSPLWSETHPAVPVSNGVFSVQLGSNTALFPELFASASAYLEIDVDPAGAEPLETLSPRQRLVMSPYAFTAEQLVHHGDIRLNAGTAYSTFTVSGDLLVPYGVSAGSASLSGGLTASSATLTATGGSQYGVAVSSGIRMAAGTLKLEAGSRGLDASGTGVVAGTGTFTATGGAQYSLLASSGIRMAAGTLTLEAGSRGLDASGTGVVAGTGTFTATGADPSVRTSSGIAMEAGVLQVGSSNGRVLYEDASNGAVAVSTHLAVAGNISAANFGIELIQQVSLSGAAATLDSGTFQTRRRLLLTIDIPGVAATCTAQLRFNSDSAANYQYRISDDNGTATTSAGATQIILHEANSANERMFQLWISNIAAENKMMTVEGGQFMAAGTAPRQTDGVAIWRNTVDQITSIQLRNSAGTNFNAGTRMTIFGVVE